MTNPLAWYVYAITATPQAALPEGAAILPGSGVAWWQAGGLFAVVSQVPRALFDAACPDNAASQAAWVAERAAGHHRVVSALHEAGPCLPLGFGTLFETEAAVLAWLSARAAAALAGLAQLASREEWVLRLSADAQALASWALHHDPELARCAQEEHAASAGRAILLRKQLARAAQAAGRRRLEEVAVSQAVALAQSGADPASEPAPPGATHAWRLLAPRGQPPLTVIAGGADGVAARLAGPFPPYGFARCVLEAA